MELTGSVTYHCLVEFNVFGSICHTLTPLEKMTPSPRENQGEWSAFVFPPWW